MRTEDEKRSQDIQLVVSWLPAVCQKIFFFGLPLPSLYVPLTHSAFFLFQPSRRSGRPREEFVYQHLFFFFFLWVHISPAASFFLALVCVLLRRNSLTLPLSCSSVFTAASQQGRQAGRQAGQGGFPSLLCFLMRSELLVSLSSFIIPPTVEVRYTSGFKHSVKKSLLCALVLTPTQSRV